MADNRSTEPKPGTLAVHGGETRKKAHDSVTTPIVWSATYAFANTAEIESYFKGDIEREEYGRYGNPTVRAAEKKLAALEGAEDTALFSSGMAAATTALFELLKAGDHVVLTNDCYRRTRQFVTKFLSRLGVESTLVAPGDEEALRAALRPGRTKVILAESPTNPYLRVADLSAFVRVRNSCPGTNLIIDGTFATPVNQRPLAEGVDLVIHSCTKYLGGHNDLLAGAVCGRAGLVQAIKDLRGVLGGVLDPQSAFLLIRGLKTLPLRVQRQNQTALEVAAWLERHPRVRQVFYPGLESHPDHAIARRQMRGFGGVVSFRIRGDARETSRVIDACKLATIAPSLGAAETLIEQPAYMSYFELTTAEREAIGIYDDLVRLSLGLEDAEDVIADLEQALSA
ncbi:MAG: aminotransferase class I/II-fold pyridoxal phosphate-dependent enzyme [Deltaproteobacteria bacterium]|nr:MAG: aminotransferase class I/II-fold pyridoxal phosphate-dependent enzyme [Deltaproteobacteria bacterium]TMB33722.1 MAG: aminotransferase class I/II-fold pyridoxal phosphate-dependent enzyme [Deltaproteobacteria bacterium]